MAGVIIENIRKRAKERNISIAKLEATCLLGNGTIAKMKNPTIETLNAIATALECDVADLITEQE